MRRAALACAAAVLLFASPTVTEAQTMRLGQVLVFYIPELQRRRGYQGIRERT